MKGQSYPQLFVIKTHRLNDAQREALHAHLAASSAFEPSEAQFSFGDTVAVELMMPRRLVDALGGAPTQDATGSAGMVDPRSLTPSAAQRAVTFDSTMLRNVSPVVAHRGSNPIGGVAGAPDEQCTSARSCQWLHRIMDEIYTHRQKQFHFEYMAEHQPMNGPVPRRFKTPPPSSQQIGGRHRSSPTSSIGGHTKPLACDDLSVSAFQYLSKKFGVPAMVKQHASELLDAVRAYRSQDLEVQLFGLLLMSQAYDTLDVHKIMQWRDALLPFALLRQEPTSAANNTPVTRRFVRVRDIPGLFRKCLVDRCSNSKEDACAQEPLWHRVRCALNTWCDPLGRFPAVVSDPNFYCPPFRPTNPYVGRLPTTAPPNEPLRHTLLAFEGRFHRFQENQVVALGQLLMVLLLSWKEERMHPLPADCYARSPQRQRSPSVRVATPRRTVSQTVATPSRSAVASAAGSSSSRGAVGCKAAKTAAGHRVHQELPANNRMLAPDRHTMDVAQEDLHPPKSHPHHADPQPDPHDSPTLRASATQGVAAGGALAIVDVSPNFNPFASPPRPAAHESPLNAVASPPTATADHSPHRRNARRSVAHLFGSPSLRDEEEQFQRDIHALEMRLARSVRGKPHEQLSTGREVTTV